MTSTRHRRHRRTALLAAPVGLIALLAVSACTGSQRSAAGPDSVLGPAELAAPAPDSAPVEPGVDGVPAAAGLPVGLGWGRGVDLCIFNRRSEPITVAFANNPKTQGSPEVAPGNWYCGYDFSDAVVQGRITGLPNESALFYAENPGLGAPNISVDLMSSADARFCGIRNSFDVGESDVTDSGDVRYAFGRNSDDDNWKYMYIYVQPSQGATPECVGKKP